MNKLENEQKLIEVITSVRLNVYGNIENYIYNIKLSETFYPALSLLEVALRNRICNAIEKFICKNWLIAELEKQNILTDKEYQRLKEAENKIKKANKKVTNDRLISELTFGFWIHLCTKSYKPKLWDKRGFFEEVFPNYTNNGNLRNISPIQNDLLNILRLRNRIFHHEIIIKSNKQPVDYYQSIINMLHLLSSETLELLNNISRFEEISKQKP